jgi:O-antigen ligase
MIQKKALKIKEFFSVAEIPGYVFLAEPVISFISLRQREAEAYASIDLSAIIQMFYVFISFITALYFLFLSPKDKPVLIFKSPQIYLLFYIILCFISMLWSSDIYITGYRAFEAFTSLALITLVVQRLIKKLSYQEIIDWAIIWIIWILIWSILSSMKWAGISYLPWPFKSGRLAVPIFFFFAIFLTRRKIMKYLIVLFTVLSFSNKVFFGIAFGMLGFFYGNVKFRSLFIILGLGFAIAFSLWGETVLQNTLFYGREGVGMEYTSGRNMIWKGSWEYYTQKPILGHGYVVGESNYLHNNFKRVITTHNFILSGLVGTGILGALSLIAYFFSAFKTSTSSVFNRSIWKVAFVSTIIMAIIVSLTSPGVGARVYGSWTSVVFVITLISGIQYKAEYEGLDLRQIEKE